MKLTPRRVIGACALASAAAIAGTPAAASAAPGSGGKPASCTVAAHATKVPASFKASAMTWTSAADGWVLGAIPQTTSNSNCPHSQVVSTADGGKTWKLDGTIKAQIPKLGLGTSGITEIRMATPKVGWIFAPDLYRTADGGKTWTAQPIPGGGKEVLDLAVTQAAAYAIVSPCAYMTGFCGNGRKPLTAWRTSLTGGTWTQMKLPARLHINVAADVAAFGRTVYVINPRVEQSLHTQFFASTDGGAHFSARPNPCTSKEEFSLIQAAPYSASKVGLLCDGNPGFSKAVKAVYLSSNTGSTDSFAGIMSVWGIQAQLTVSPSGNLAVGAWSDGSFIDINDTKGGTTWHQIIGSGDGGAGFNDITYVSKKVAWVVFGPASMFADYGVLYRTKDAGRSWAQVHF